MSKLIHVRTEIEIPGNPSAIHIAEMQELIHTTPDTPAMCKMLRIVELAGTQSGGAITGAGTLDGKAFGLANQPNEFVPHPDTYADFPDIKAKVISAEEFEGLWVEALTKFPELG